MGSPYLACAETMGKLGNMRLADSAVDNTDQEDSGEGDMSSFSIPSHEQRLRPQRTASSQWRGGGRSRHTTTRSQLDISGWHDL